MTRSIPDASTSESRDACASKWLRASDRGRPVVATSSAMTAAAKPGGVLIPVPTAVPPSGSSPMRGSDPDSRSTPVRIAAA